MLPPELISSRGFIYQSTAVLLLGVVFAGISIPAVKELRSTLLLSARCETLVLGLQSLALKAQQNGRKIILEPYPAGYRAFAAGQEATPILDKKIPASFSLSVSPAKVTFYPGGTSSPAALVLADDSRSCTVTVSLRGRVKSRR